MAYTFDPPRFPPSRHSPGEQENRDVTSRTVWGSTLLDNPVPTWTAEAAAQPFVQLEEPGTRRCIGLSHDLLSHGLLALADPGGGKTNLFDFVLRGMLEHPGDRDKIFIFDTKGDYLLEFGNRVPAQERVIIGLGEAYRPITAVHNIFSEIMRRDAGGCLVYGGDCDTDALALCSELFSKMPSDTQPVFPNMAMQLLCAVLIYFMRTYTLHAPDRLNNLELVRYLEKSTAAELTAMLDLPYMEDQRSIRDYIAGKNSQSQGVLSYLGTVVRKLFIDAFAMHDPSREFSMRQLLESPGRKVVFMEYDLRLGGVMAPMYGVLIDRAMANALGGRQGRRPPCYLLLDEMLLLPKLEHLARCLSFGRAQGVRVVCGLQNLPGVVDIYGEAGAKQMLACFQNLFVFHLSDSDTRQFVVERLGRNYQLLTCYDKDGPTTKEGYTVEDWRLMALGLGDAVVVLRGERPFLFKLPKYEGRGLV